MSTGARFAGIAFQAILAGDHFFRAAFRRLNRWARQPADMEKKNVVGKRLTP